MMGDAHSSTTRSRSSGLLGVIGPGLLVAATGVGAGDLATAGFAGCSYGLIVLWAVALGAILKFVLTEGLARWQLSTGQTILEGVNRRLGRIAIIIFLAYMLPWSFFTCAALMSACGAAAHAIFPVFGDDTTMAKLVFGGVHSAIGVIVAWQGGFRLFQRIMAICIAIMFTTVIITAIMLRPDLGDVLSGLFTPRIPDADGEGFRWTIALMGGVGGTLTVLCYGYWMREEGRISVGDLPICRVDLFVGYLVTALFGISMVIIASGMTASGKGISLIIDLANQLEEPLGPVGRWLFLIGAWSAVVSSLLGVWQAVPFIFMDAWDMVRRRRATMTSAINPRRRTYRVYLLMIATIPLIQMSRDFREVQKVYAILGAAFIPMLALVLLILNSRGDWIGREYRNRIWTIGALLVAIAVFGLFGYYEIQRAWG